jgi:hypothetical protein
MMTICQSLAVWDEAERYYKILAHALDVFDQVAIGYLNSLLLISYIKRLDFDCINKSIFHVLRYLFVFYYMVNTHSPSEFNVLFASTGTPASI